MAGPNSNEVFEIRDVLLWADDDREVYLNASRVETEFDEWHRAFRVVSTKEEKNKLRKSELYNKQTFATCVSSKDCNIYILSKRIIQQSH